MSIIDRRRMLGLVLALPFAAATAEGAVMPGEWFVTAGGGWVNGSEAISSINSTFGDSGSTRSEYDSVAGKNSSAVSAQIFYQLTPNLGLGAQFVAPRYSGSEHVTAFHEQIYLASARYLFTPERNWNPYLIGGIGAVNQSFHTRGQYCGNCSNTLSPLPPPEASFHTLGMAGSVGLGVQGELMRHFVGGLETGILFTQSGGQEIPSEVLTPSSSATSVSNGIRHSKNVAIYLAARIGFDFGGGGRP